MHSHHNSSSTEHYHGLGQNIGESEQYQRVYTVVIVIIQPTMEFNFFLFAWATTKIAVPTVFELCMRCRYQHIRIELLFHVIVLPRGTLPIVLSKEK